MSSSYLATIDPVPLSSLLGAYFQSSGDPIHTRKCIDFSEYYVLLQGTAVIPPGHRDTSGRTMNYEEGADRMREADASRVHTNAGITS